MTIHSKAMSDDYAASKDGSSSSSMEGEDEDVNVFVFDIETDGLVDRSREDDEREWRRIHMTVCVGMGPSRDDVLKIVADDRCRISHEDMTELQTRLDKADVIIAYNGRAFDLRVLRNYYDLDLVDAWNAKLLDPFEIIRAKSGSWVKLDELLSANGRPLKSAKGSDAAKWWEDGERDKVLAYCQQDVECLFDLTDEVGKMRFPLKRWQGDRYQATEYRVLRWDRVMRQLRETILAQRRKTTKTAMIHNPT